MRRRPFISVSPKVTGFTPTEKPALLASFNHELFSAALNEELAKLIVTLVGEKADLRKILEITHGDNIK